MNGSTTLEKPAVTEEEVGGRIRIPGVPLKLADRCDGPGLQKEYPERAPFCGAQAFVRIKLHNGELLFCGHHYSRFEYVFISSGYEIDDQRDRINEKPSVSTADVG